MRIVRVAWISWRENSWGRLRWVSGIVCRGLRIIKWRIRNWRRLIGIYELRRLLANLGRLRLGLRLGLGCWLLYRLTDGCRFGFGFTK